MVSIIAGFTVRIFLMEAGRRFPDKILISAILVCAYVLSFNWILSVLYSE